MPADDRLSERLRWATHWDSHERRWAISQLIQQLRLLQRTLEGCMGHWGQLSADTASWHISWPRFHCRGCREGRHWHWEWDSWVISLSFSSFLTASSFRLDGWYFFMSQHISHFQAAIDIVSSIYRGLRIFHYACFIDGHFRHITSWPQIFFYWGAALSRMSQPFHARPAASQLSAYLFHMGPEWVREWVTEQSRENAGSQPEEMK